MLEYKKYLMRDSNDYRPDVNKHSVILITTKEDGTEWAYGRFSIVDEDMLDITEEEMNQLPHIEIPNISLRQCRELLIRQGKFSTVTSALANIEDESQRLILTNFWEYSAEFERNHPSLKLVTSMLGMTDDQTDIFFLEAVKL